jgi:hypothetical protein
VTKSAAHLREYRWKPGESGNPSGDKTPKRFTQLYEQMAAEFPDLSPTDQVMLGQAARLIARSEKTAKPSDAIRLSSESRRILQDIRRSAKAATPDPMAELNAITDAIKAERDEA